MNGASLASEVRDRGGLDRHAGLAGHDGERATSLHHGDHLRPFRRIGLGLESMARFDLKPGLFAGLCQEDDHSRIGVVGQVHRDIGIRVWPENPIWVAIDPDLALGRLEAQRPQAALDRVSPIIERQGGRHGHNQKSRSKDGGRNLHRRKNLILGLLREHCTAYERITYVLNAGMSTADKTTVAEAQHHA